MREVAPDFDAVAGEMTGQLLRAMPRGSSVTVYGALSMQECRIYPGDLIFQGKSVNGFILYDWFASKSPLYLFSFQKRLKSLANAEFRSEVSARYSLEQAREALGDYKANMTKGKILLLPGKQGP